MALEMIVKGREYFEPKDIPQLANLEKDTIYKAMRSEMFPREAVQIHGKPIRYRIPVYKTVEWFEHEIKRKSEEVHYLEESLQIIKEYANGTRTKKELGIRRSRRY
jgi:hypothetical protein